MLTEFSNRGPEDQAFLVGYHLAEWQHAVLQISQAVLLLSQGTPNAMVQHHVCLQTDTALVKLAKFSLEGLHKPQVYYEMAPFMQQPDPLMIGEYARLRRELAYQSPIPEMEPLVQQAIGKLTNKRE